MIDAYVLFVVCAMLFVSLAHIAFRIGWRGSLEVALDEGHSPWDDGQWVIAPKWPFILLILSLILFSKATTLATTIWLGLIILFWCWIWILSVIRFRSLNFPSDTDEPEPQYPD